jgi:hypothetical protein
MPSLISSNESFPSPLESSSKNISFNLYISFFEAFMLARKATTPDWNTERSYKIMKKYEKIL